MKTLRALGGIDTGSVLGDPMLRWLALVPLMVALAVRGVLPLVLPRVGELAAVELGWLLQPMSGYTVVGLAPLIAGTVVGFLLLDQRDDGTLLALRVTPLPFSTYLAYRLALPTLTAVIVTLAAIAVAGGLGFSSAGALLAALAAAPLAPVTALTLVAFARNKLEGAALMKAASVLLAAPLAGLFLPQPWQFALTPLPTYWVAQAVWMLQAGENAWLPIIVSWTISTCATLVLMRRLLANER